MRLWRRGVCAAVVCLALVLVAVPLRAEVEATGPEVTALDAAWEMLSDLWSGLSALWAPATEEAVTAPGPPTSTAASCGLACTERGDDIDPNG